MNKAASVKLSLRKLFIATLALGPLAILPSPLWALPTTGQFFLSNGSVTLVTTGVNGAGTANFTVSDKTVLVWTGNDASSNNTFNVASGETWGFNGLASTGAVLNKVGYNNNGSLMASAATATITGNLNSTGKVFILANGTINVAGGASIDTAGGLVLSTLPETSDFNFTTQGNLSFSGGPAGTINLGTTATQVGITTGGLSAWAGTVTTNNISVAGDVVINQTGATTAYAPIVSITSGGNVTVTTNNGTLGTAGSLWTVANGTTSLNSGAAAVTVTNAANDFKTISANNSGAFDVSINDANNVILGASTTGRDLIVTAVGTGTATAIATSGTLAIGRSGTFAATLSGGNTAINIGNNSTIGALGSFGATTASDSAITFNGLGNVTTATINTSTGAVTANKSSVSITTNGVLTVGAAINSIGNGTSGGGITLTGGSIVQGAFAVTSNAGSGVTYNATAGNITTNTMSGNTVTLNASTGSINVGGQAGLISTLAVGNISVKTSSSGSANLTASNPFFAGSTLQFTGGSIALTNTGSMIVGTTNATGNVTIIDGANVQVGTGVGTAAQNIVVSGALAITANAAAATINDGGNLGAYTATNVFGNVTLVTGVPGTTAGGAITLNAARTNAGLAPLVQFGAISANTGGGGVVTLAETSTLNVAGINATSATLASVNGNIVQSGNFIKTSGSTTAIVGSTGTINLGNTSNDFTSIILTGGTDATVVAGNSSQATALSVASTAPGNLTYTSGSGVNTTVAAATYGNLTVNSGGTTTNTGTVTGNTITLNSTGALTTAGTLGGTNLTLQSPAVITLGGSVSPTNLVINSTAAGAGAVVETGTASITGNTVVNSTGNVALSGNNDFATVTLNTTGDTTVNDINNLTLNGTSGGQVSATAGFGTSAIASTWNLSLGNLSVNALVATASNGGGGNSGTITQSSGSVLHSENLASFTTANGNIVVANAGNSAGPVVISSGTGTASYAEDSTVKLRTLTTNAATTITSRTGSIIEDTSVATTAITSNSGGLTLNATAGSIRLGGVTQSGNTTTGTIATLTATAPSGLVEVITSGSNTGTVISGNTQGNTTIANIAANSLVLITGNNNTTESGAINVFGTANFTTSGNITLSGSSNNFGPILVNSTVINKNVSITESGTMNLRTITFLSGGNGTFTANSVNGDIISSGFGGVRPGGNSTGAGTGVVTLTALKGNITVGDATTDFPTTGGVVFNGNNVSLTVLGNSTLILGSNTTASVAGNLTITSAIGSVANNGNIVVSGNASFTTGNGNISLNQSGDQFGTLKFSGNQVNVIQSNDMKLLTGSSAIGPSSLASSGNISIVNSGGVASFGNTLSLIASGNITLPKLIQVANTLTVNAAGTKDLSSLSITGDLGGKTPVNLGAGAYLQPQP